MLSVEQRAIDEASMSERIGSSVSPPRRWQTRKHGLRREAARGTVWLLRCGPTHRLTRIQRANVEDGATPLADPTASGIALSTRPGTGKGSRCDAIRWGATRPAVVRSLGTQLVEDICPFLGETRGTKQRSRDTVQGSAESEMRDEQRGNASDLRRFFVSSKRHLADGFSLRRSRSAPRAAGCPHNTAEAGQWIYR